MKSKIIFLFLFLSLSAFAQTKKNVVRKKAPKSTEFLYGNVLYTSFADEVVAEVQGQKVQARSIFSGFGLGADYTFYFKRYIYGWNATLISGHVDIERVLTKSYPRVQFLGFSTGPELGYRLNSDFDISYSAGLLYRDITSIGQSFVVANQINLKFRLTPRFTFFQNFGNYGKEKSYSYSIGMRWLL